MKKKLFDTNSVYFKYIVSYAALLCIPVLFFIIVYSVFEENVESESRSTHEYKLGQVVSRMDSCLKNAVDTSYRLSELEELDLKSADQYDLYLLQQQLKDITGHDELFYDVGLYYMNSPWILTSNSEYTADEFVRRYLPENYSVENLKEVLYENDMLIFSSAFSDRTLNSELVTLIVRPTFFENKGMMFFMIEKNKFDDLISDVLFGHESENILFIDSQGLLKYSKNILDEDVVEYTNTDKWQRFDLNHINVFEDRIGSQKYIISATESDYLNIYYLLLTPKSAYFGDVYRMRIVVFGLFLFILAMGALMIYLAMKMNYNPLKDLYERTRELSGFKESGNEIDSIHKGLDIFADKEKQYIAEVSASHESMRNDKLLKLLRTEIDKEVFLKDADDLNLDTDNSYYRVVTIHICHDIIEYKRSDVEKWLKGQYKNYFNGIYVDIYENENFAFVVQQPDDELLLKELNRLKNDMTAEFNLVFCIGVGKSYFDIENIKSSSIESITAIRYSYIYGNNSVIEFDKLSIDKEYKTINIAKELEVLKTLLGGRNIEESVAQIKHIISKIKNSGSNIFSVKRAIIELVSLTSKWIRESEVGFEENGEKLNMKNSVAALSMDAIASADTIDIAEDLLINVCTYLYDPTSDEKEIIDESQILRNNFMNYINENCYDANFSIKQMASDFNITQSYLSQRFKVITGQTISSYINNKRIEKAKDMLINTDILIKDIILEIGYYDVSSFLRKFKQCEGITPGAYREKYKIPHS